MSTPQKVPPLRRYLDERGMTIADFHRLFNRASKVQVSDVSVSYWARGVVSPRIYHQSVIRRITRGEVTPSDWAEWAASQESGDHGESVGRGRNRKIQSEGAA